MQPRRFKSILFVLLCCFVTALTGCPDEADDPNDQQPDDPDEISITIDDQTLDEDAADTITVNEAVIDADGFAVIYEDDGGGPGDTILGASELLDDDTHQDFEIELDRDAEDGETMWGLLHYDESESGEFEDPAEQPAARFDDEVVRDDFQITIDTDEPVSPSINIEDQTLPEDEADAVEIDSYTIDDDGFAVIHEDDDGQPGAIIGYTDLLEEGSGSDVVADLNRDAEDGETLWGMLHYDATDAGLFEDPADQPPVLDDDEQPVVDDFEVSVDDEPQPDPDEPFIDVSDQTLDGVVGNLSTLITVDEVYADDIGWAVIHDDDCSEDSDIIGYASLSEGNSSQVNVELSEPAADEGDDRDLCAMLHADGGDPDEFQEEFDLPVLDSDGNEIGTTFNVEVVEGTAAIRFNLGADGADNYTLQTVEPMGYTDDFDADGGLDDLALRGDWRYELVNGVTNDHPFEFLDDAGDALLSQDTDGSLEDNDSIGWNAQDTWVRFTVSDDFIDDVDEYSCAVHSTMSGAVTIID